MMIGFFAEARSSATAAISSASGAGRRITQSRSVEELGGEVVGVGLHVLRQGQHHGTGLDRVDQGADRRRQCGQQLLGAGDPVEEPADRPEDVVHGQVGVDRVLQLLQHRSLVSGGVGVTRQQEHREPVHGGQGRPGDQVHRARTDRRGHGQGGAPPGVLGEPDRRVHQGLFVAALDERHRLVQLVQGLAQAGHVAVAEDAQGGGDQPAALAVGNGVLPGQVGHHRLGDGQSDGGGRGHRRGSFSRVEAEVERAETGRPRAQVRRGRPTRDGRAG